LGNAQFLYEIKIFEKIKDLSGETFLDEFQHGNDQCADFGV
jgi:hypothetical protein